MCALSQAGGAGFYRSAVLYRAGIVVKVRRWGQVKMGMLRKKASSSAVVVRDWCSHFDLAFSIEQAGTRAQDRVLIVCVVARRRTTRIGSSPIAIASMAMIVTNGLEHFA